MSENLPTPKWSTLVDRLCQYTLADKLDWKTSSDESAIHVKIGENRVVISRVRNRHSSDAFDYWVEILKADGRIVDRFSDEMVPDSYPKLNTLYSQAFRQANGSDLVLNSILEALPDDTESPF